MVDLNKPSTRHFESINVDVYSTRSPSLIVVSWVWKESMIPLSRYRIFIYRGESSSELELIASDIDPTSTDRFEDRTARLVDKHRVYFYKVVARNIQQSVQVESELATWEGPLDFVGLYIVEEHNFLFRYVAGTPLYILKMQTDSSSKCTNCWDSIAKRITKSNCTYCHGTGMIGKGVGGYYDPVYAWGDLSPDPEMIQIAQWGKVQATQTDMFFSNYPRLSIGDLVIEILTNKRWKVERVSDTEKRRVKMLQIVRLDLINKDQVEYKIPIPKTIVDQARRELNERVAEPEF